MLKNRKVKNIQARLCFRLMLLNVIFIFAVYFVDSSACTVDSRGDVLFLMDSSRENSPLDWYNTKQLFSDVTLSLPLGADAFRVAAVSYSTYSRLGKCGQL